MRAILLGVALCWTGAADAETLADLAWLEGCWRATDSRGETTEVWRTPPMPAMLGYAATQRDGQTIAWKQARIEVVGDDLVYYFMPDGRWPTPFHWAELRRRDGVADVGHVVFANDQPRFPQQISYTRDGAALTLRMSGPRRREEVFQYARIECPDDTP